MAAKRIRVAVTGAAGHIGYALVFRIASGSMFGSDTEVDLNLIELEPALPSLQGIVMELEDCAFPLLKNIVCTSDLNVGMSAVNWAILVGAVPRKAGMERGDLLQINGNIFTKQGKAINDNAAADVRVLVVGNPCNTNCLIAMNNAPNIPSDRFFAMTLLDEKRARAQLAIKAGVAVSEIQNVTIWGNHSSTQYPDFYHAKIAQRPVTEVITDITWLQNDFLNNVQKRGAAVIAARGSSSAASAANAIVENIYQLTHDTPEHENFSVALCSDGQYGVDKGLIFSMPCYVKNGKFNVVTDRQHGEFAQEKLRITLQELREERDAVKQLGLIK